MAIDDYETCKMHNMLVYKNLRREPTRFDAHKDTIHSGHFMVSNVHDVNADDDDSDDEAHQPLSPEQAYNFVTANKETSDTYNFGPRSTQTMAIDASLTKLFQCMTLAYSGTITSPKWKTFRGLALALKDKIRLNNIIWREWHMQYVFKHRPNVCQFATPLSDDIHLKPESVVLEGKYWKRRLDTVTAEYKKWRRYFKNRRVSGNRGEAESHVELLERVAVADPLPRRTQQSSTDLMLTGDTEMEAMDFSDSFFQSLNSQPFAFPNPREISQIGGCADLIQPNLIPLQPDFMDTDFGDLLSSARLQFTSESDLSALSFLAGNTISLGNSVDGTTVSMEGSDMNLLPNNYSNNNNNSNNLSNLALQLLGGLEASSPSQTLASPAMAPVSDSTPTQSQRFSGAPVPSPSEKAPHLTSVLTQKTPGSATPVSKSSASSHGHSRSPRSRQGRQTSAGSPSNRSASAPSPPGPSKDGFAVPMGKPLQMPRKQRTIAPAPSVTTAPTPSPAASSTYLAELLTKGVYHGAAFNVKKEPGASACLGNYTPIRPAAPTPQQVVPTQPPVAPTPAISALDFSKVKADFATSMVIAAVSQAVGTTSVKDMPAFPSTSYASPAAVSSPMSPLSAETSPQPSYSPGSPSSDFGLQPGSPGSLNFLIKDGSEAKGPYQEHRRQAHLSAEQKRRCNLKVRQPANQTGFDALLSLVPALAQNPKVSKAAMLQKTADYCKKLKSEKSQMQKEAEILRHEIDFLNNEIGLLQSHLPETGVPVTRQRVDQMKEMFEEYVRSRTLQNWKFWIFSIIIRSLFDSYNSMVSTSSIDELCRTVLAWLDQHCSLTALRPTVLNALRHLSTTTSILSEPSRVQEQATEAVTRRNSFGSSRDGHH